VSVERQGMIVQRAISEGHCAIRPRLLGRGWIKAMIAASSWDDGRTSATPQRPQTLEALGRRLLAENC